jgi:hypothetical protein
MKSNEFYSRKAGFTPIVLRVSSPIPASLEAMPPTVSESGLRRHYAEPRFKCLAPGAEVRTSFLVTTWPRPSRAPSIRHVPQAFITSVIDLDYAPKQTGQQAIESLARLVL